MSDAAAAKPAPAAGEASPLVRTILDGAAPPNIRLAAARGALPLPRSELLLVLVTLCSDPEEEVASTARASLEGWPPDELRRTASESGTPGEILSFLLTLPQIDADALAALCANPGTPVGSLAQAGATLTGGKLDILLAAQTRLIESPQILAAIESNPSLTPLQRSRTEEIRRHFLASPGSRADRPAADSGAVRPAPAAPPPGPGEAAPSEPGPATEVPEPPAPGKAPPPGAKAPPATGEPDPAGEVVHQGAYQRILNMNVTQKIALATKGDREERLVLIRDANRSVQEAVIGSPKITENEVEAFAKMRSIKDTVLRTIAGRRDWMKNYGIVRSLAYNPKTPLPISMALLKRLTVQDLKVLMTDRNIPDALRRMSKKTLDQRLSRSR